VISSSPERRHNKDNLRGESVLKGEKKVNHPGKRKKKSLMKAFEK